MENFIRSVVKLVIAVFLLFFIVGCLGDTILKKPQQESSDVESKSKETTAVYYDFEDVLIPKELQIIEKTTVIVSTPGFTSGIIALKGRIERTSLFNFFSSNMQKDNWSVISQLKSPATIIMVFQKSSRTSVITIRDDQFFTYVEVGVAPTVSGEEFSETTLIE